MSNNIKKIRKCVKRFCDNFVENPYLCYTEHGLHALFFRDLYDELETVIVENNRVGNICLIQKEYRTAENLGLGTRSNWDISVIKKGAAKKTKIDYDNLDLIVAIEFGLNATKYHLVRDIYRLCNNGANLKYGIVVHLQRISGIDATDVISGRDSAASYKSTLEINLDDKEDSLMTELTEGIKKIRSSERDENLIAGFCPEFYKNRLDIYIATHYDKNIRNEKTKKNYVIHFEPGLESLTL